MADTVRYFMEQMIPELEAYEQRGLFSKIEIRRVVRRREQFEYLLKRPAAEKADYLRYVQYEMKLEQLRLARQVAKGADAAAQADGEGAIVRRIHFIFDRACRKHRGDLRLWLRWLRFCRESESPRQMGRALATALRLHPTAAALWSYAAAWEFDANGNAAAARALMQQGLRACRRSERLWLDYFRMELVHAAKLCARRRVLGIGAAGTGPAVQPSTVDVPAADTPGAVEAEQAASVQQLVAGAGPGLLQMEPAGGSTLLQQGEGAASSAAPAPVPDATSVSEAAVQAVLRGAIAKVVYDSAIAVIPDSPAFRREFLAVLNSFAARLAGTDALQQHVLASMRRDFAGRPELWATLADAAADAAAGPEEGLQALQAVLAEGLAACGPSAALFDVCADVVGQHQQRLAAAQAGCAADKAGAEGGDRESAKQLRRQAKALTHAAEATAKALLQLCRRAFEAQAASEQLLLAWPGAALQAGRPVEALQAAAEACKRQPGSAALWMRRLTLEAQRLALQVKRAASSGEGAAAPATPKQHPTSSSSDSSDDESTGEAAPASAQAAARHAAAAELDALAVTALAAVPAPSSRELWLLALDQHASLVHDETGAGGGGGGGGGLGCCARLLAQLQRVLAGQAKGPLRGGLGEVAAVAVQQLQQQQGLQAARRYVNGLACLPSAGGSFWQAVLQAELAEVQQGSSQADPPRLRRLCEAGVAAHGADDVELWLLYVRAEAMQRHDVGRLQWRACKALRDPQPFQEGISSLAA